ncbi:adenylate/guanylate cyclase domain-containing protein [Bradyrhizobium sp. Tv2a-2]|uniref:adenylate/guanylate cyclase domain-containing protein n=1 Tax=Bradyrhizobium sp. Tv2a-2 TaxID=113395 RepID=UPI00040AF03A|nr:adenylate/guanylate cyclase domain-containing protein [Bradyrhizobium sp. Tv2a-2]
MSDPMAVSRRLVAVFAADVEGYSRLMGADEVGTLKSLTERRAVLDRIIGEHRGRIANTAGDSVLAEFGSAVDAVQCAVEAQTALAEVNSTLAPDRCISFRIGIHIGDVMVRGGDLFGDGVNIAARLQTLAKPGGVCISGATYDQVRKVLPITFADLGAQRVKNIQEPIRAYQVDATSQTQEAASEPLAETESAPPLPDRPSIAVLPFENMSGDPEQEYFADGMVEEIITALSRFKSLFVIARNSSFSYKGKAIDVKRVGRELGVRYVLEGSVRKAGSRLRIAAQLIDAASGAHIWADRFDGALEDVFKFQDEVTEKVVGAIAPRVERAEIVRAWRRPPSNTDAYDCYLRGLRCLSPMTVDGLEQALGLFTKASALDPDYASAYGMAMHCHAHRFDLLLAEADDIAHRRSEISRLWQIVARVGQDDGVALGEAAWAVAYLLRDLSSARKLIDRALELNPNLASAWAINGWINIWQGHPDLAIEHLGRAERLDPGSLRLTSFAAMAHARFFMGEYEWALGLAEGMLRHSPDAHVCLRIGAASAAFAGHIDTAHGLAARLQVIDPAFGVSRLREYLGPYQRSAFVEKYAEGLRLAGLPE